MPNMQSAIEWLYGTSVSSAIRDTSWIVPTVQAIHICAITVVVGSALVTELRIAVGNRYQIFTGVDDLILESAVLGIEGLLRGVYTFTAKTCFRS